MTLFSIIIPAYNAQATIERCLDSVYALPVSENDFEVIVIDDCSSDGTVSIARGYAERHSNLTVILQLENHRQGAARNRGISMAQGKYVVFLDSDDEIAPGVLSAIELAEKNELEIVAIRGVGIGLDGRMQNERRLPYLQNQVFSGVTLQTDHPYWCSGPVLYVYLRRFIVQVGYPFAEDVLYEDCDFVNVHLYHAKRMSYCDTVSYRIHDNLGSTTRTKSSKHVCDYGLLGTRMLDFYTRIDDKTSSYALGILEGGSYNIMKSFRALSRLHSWSEVRSCYDRFDTNADRKELLRYKEPAYCWNWWTRFCLKHRRSTIFLAGCAGFLRQLVLKIKPQ